MYLHVGGFDLHAALRASPHRFPDDDGRVRQHARGPRLCADVGRIPRVRQAAGLSVGRAGGDGGVGPARPRRTLLPRRAAGPRGAREGGAGWRLENRAGRATSSR